MLLTTSARMLKHWFHWIENDFSQVPFNEFTYILIPVMIIIFIITWNVDKIHIYAEDPYNYTNLKMGKTLFFLGIGLEIFMISILF